MALSSVFARKACTAEELELFQASLSRSIQGLSLRELKSGVSRARKLRDKYRKLADQQDRESRGKGRARSSRPAEGSVATRKKEQLFVETLERYENRLMEVKAETEADGGATSRPAKSAKRSPRGKSPGRSR